MVVEIRFKTSTVVSNIKTYFIWRFSHSSNLLAISPNKAATNDNLIFSTHTHEDDEKAKHKAYYNSLILDYVQ